MGCATYSWFFYTPPPPPSTKLKGGYTGITLSVCGQNRFRSVSSTILVGSISYLHILSSNFRKCVACNVRFKVKKLKKFNVDFVFFWQRSQCPIQVRQLLPRGLLFPTSCFHLFWKNILSAMYVDWGPPPLSLVVCYIFHLLTPLLRKTWF